VSSSIRAGSAKKKCACSGRSFPSFFHGTQQLDLLDAARHEKLERLAKATDQLRNRFGFSKLQFGGSLGHDDENNPSGGEN